MAALLKHLKKDNNNMCYWANSVLSGDTQNHEGRDKVYYWKTGNKKLTNVYFLIGMVVNSMIRDYYSIG